ncbi:TrkA family potassium uptake protein [Clostridium tertium]|jgi:trk system potassium uptake protein|uniref:TrkA family potassium uptake protein n=4 Tax=Clostridium tertium TaxID=1559 RepID=A0A9X3XK64_9CLOT|nr:MULTISPECIES: TrkA family potassium uptake protein [Clostridium]MBS5306252.1 TrkA family potassium uptake protein [Clostridium sp.]MBS6500358.1 TrkA family potassium uptake protein [Clostridium sp.]MDB1922242.1 TrkA family potassium uptake protein [Clostridium tertium]MDB1926699.1 TrkA family potassium uptake protein [Clostridium tertium]MDB1929907.1 TrkA family potassium uptake protein [Clostridium tertium]
MFNHRPEIEFGIIGIGRFGFALAKTLIEAGKEVIVLDNNENKIKQIRSLTENAFVVNNLDKETLEETGIQNCETVFVCIGEKIDVSILTTLNVINMGVKRVISKAITYEQGCVLKKIGAEIVYPENDMAIRIANRLLNEEALEFIELNNDIHIEELRVTSKIDGKSILKSKIRNDFNLNIIALERDEETIIEVDPNYILRENDLIVVIGKKSNIRKLEEYLNNK